MLLDLTEKIINAETVQTYEQAVKEMADYLLNVPSTDTPRIQESHIMLGHIICEIVEAQLFPRV